ncbi:hypothetical protein D3OALGA1CA_3435 [Olavius algarvensis associated proteobacterium Delta 3]|nr:hypothetical protein D3OALGA1CA_3435 [Olavius algarvensis associated proteobacterium Delta 3]
MVLQSISKMSQFFASLPKSGFRSLDQVREQGVKPLKKRSIHDSM